MPKPVDILALEQLATPVVAGLGYELVDLEWKHEAGHWVLRVLIDLPEAVVEGVTASAAAAMPLDLAEPGSPAARAAPGVGLADCSRVSHSLGAELDVADALHVPFHLEVSSPGLDRPLKRESDFRRFAGQKAKVRTRTPVPDFQGLQGLQGTQASAVSAGRRNFVGKLLGAEGGQVKIEVDGRTFQFPVGDVEKANLVYEF